MATNSKNRVQEVDLKPIGRLFEIETQFMAARGFFQNDEARRLRRNAINRIQELSLNGGFDYDPYVPFLAVAYFDRCISWHPLQDQRSYVLFVISCVVLAWKMRFLHFRLTVFLDSNRLYIHPGEIESMEHRILYVLNWRVQSVTALCFLDFFISFFYISDAEQIATFKRRILENKLLHMHYDATYTEFKPSTIAVTALIAEKAQNTPVWNVYLPFMCCQFVDMDELENCLNLLMAQERANNVRIYPIPPSPPPTHLAADDDEDEEEAAAAAAAALEEEVERQRRRIGRLRATI